MRAILIFLVVLSYTLSFAQKKVWEDESGGMIRKNIDEGLIMLSKDFSSKAKPTDFTLTGVYGLQNLVKFRFDGSCASVVLVKFNIGRPELIGLNIQSDSKVSGSELKLESLLKNIKDAFLEQCPEVNTIRIEVALPYIEPYKGEIKADNNWQLTDGYGQTDENYTFSINYRYGPYNKTGFQYEGPCQTNFDIELKPMYRNDSEAALSKKPRFEHYEATAIEAVKKIKAECPDVNQIKFRMNAVPEYYKCPSDTECYLVAQKQSDWVLSIMGYEYNPESNVEIRTYNDVLKYLEKGDLSVFKNYTRYFGLFFEDFIYVYSEQCKKTITNPVVKTIVTYETTFDEQGNKLKREEMGNPLEVTMEKEFEAAFEKYFKKNKYARFMQGIDYFLKSNNFQFSNPVGDHLQYYRMNQYMIERFLNENCNSVKATKVKNSILKLIQ